MFTIYPSVLEINQAEREETKSPKQQAITKHQKFINTDLPRHNQMQLPTTTGAQFFFFVATLRTTAQRWNKTTVIMRKQSQRSCATIIINNELFIE